MVKHPACAAPISSSGFVPRTPSKRVANEYGVLESAPLSVEIVPLPSLSDPFQTAEALRTMMFPPYSIGCEAFLLESIRLTERIAINIHSRACMRSASVRKSLMPWTS